MNSLKIFGSVALLTLIAGCVISHGPKNEAAFAAPSDLKQLEGCYENKGDGGTGGNRHLSSYVFTTVKKNVSQAEYIRVVLVGERSIKVSAESKGQVLQEQVFIEGKDFNFESGQIKIRSEGAVGGPTEPGSVFLGVGHGSTYLGIDKNGDGKLQDSSSMLGTVFLVMPVAGYIKESFRFKKNPELCKAVLPS